MALWLVPLNYALPAIQAYLSTRGQEPLDHAEAQAVTALLERCIKTCEALVAFALLVGGKPSRQ
jgi:hypothetical protein